MNTKTTPRLTISVFAVAVAALFLAAGQSAFADRIKANNTTALNNTASWSGTTLPTSSEYAVWDSAYVPALTYPGPLLGLGGNLTFGGIKIANPEAVVITNDSNTLTLNGVSGTGIDMSLAVTNLTINSGLSLGAAQTWNVTNNQVMAAGGTVSGTGPLTKSGGGAVVLANGTYTGGTTVSAGTVKLASPVMAGLQLWLDASDTTTLTLAGSTNGVTKWVDKSGHTNHATAGTAPTFATNANLSASAAGLGRVVRFGATSTYLNVNLSSLAGRAYTIIALEIDNNAAGFFIGNSGGAGDQVLQVGYTAANNFRFTQWNNDMNYAVTATSTLPRTWTAKFDNLTKYLYLNGVFVVSGTGAGNLNGTGLATGYIGSTTSATGNTYHGDLAEILVYSRALSETERKTVEAYLNAKWFGSARGGLPSTGALSIASSAILDLDGQSQTVASLADSGSPGGTVDNSGAGATFAVNLASSATNIFSGTVMNTAPYPGLGLALNGGPGGLLLSGTNSSWSGPNSIGSGTTLLVSNNVGNVVISGGIGGSGYLTKNGNGTLVLKNTNNFIGNLTIQGGKLVLGNGNVFETIINGTNVIVSGSLAGAGAGTAPPTVSAAPKIWLDASDAATILTNASGSVTNWLDKSGNTNNFATLLNSGTAILYTNSTTPSGRKTVTFNAGYALLNTTYRNQSSPNISVFVITKKRTSGGANQGVVACTDGVNNDWNGSGCMDMDYGGSDNTPQTMRGGSGTGYGTYEPSTLYHDFEYMANGTVNTVYVNGNRGSADAAGNFNISAIGVGTRLGGVSGTLSFDGDIAEVLVYNAALSAADRQAVENYLYYKWLVPSATISGGSVSNTPLISVAGGATFDVSQAAGGFTLNAGQTLAGSGVVTGSVATATGAVIQPGGVGAYGTMIITNSSLTLANSTNTFDLSAVPATVGGGVNDLLIVNGNLTLSSGSQIVINSSTLVSGTYTLVQYSGTRSGTFNPTVIFTGGSTPSSYNLDYSLANNLRLVVTVGSQTLGSLTFTQQPTDATAGVAISPAVKVTALDMGSAPIAGLYVTVALTNSSMGILSGIMTTNTDANGVAWFTNLSVNLSGSGKVLVASSGLVSANSGSFSINPAGASQLLMQTQPASTATAGAAFSPQPTVKIADQFGNVVTTDFTTVVTAVATNGTLQSSGLLTATASAGIATFSGFNITNAGVNALNFTSSPVFTGVQSANISVSAAQPATLAFVQQPTGTNAGQVIAPAVTVLVKDAFGNSVSGATVGVSLSGTGTLSGTLGNTSSSSGIATFSNLSVNLAGSKALTATNATASSATSSSFTISGGTVTQLIWTTQPGLATNFLPFAIQPVLQTADAFGNPTTIGLPATLNVTVTNNAGTGPLVGTTTTNIGASGGNGVVSFSNLELDSIGTDKQLTASVPAGFGAPVSGMAVWLDANNSSTVLTNASGSVTNWMDLSGNGNNFNNLLGPGFIGYTNRTTPSGRTTVSFVNGLLFSTTYRNSGSAISVFIITKKRTTGNSNGSQYQGPLDVTDGSGNQDYNTSTLFAMDYGGSQNTPLVERGSGGPNYGTYEPSTVYHDFEYIANSSANTLYINGAGGNTGGTVGAFAITNIAVGGRISGPQYLDGDVAEVLVYNTALSTADRQTVETYLSNKWFTVTHPGNYPVILSNAVSAVFTVYQAPSVVQVESAADGSGVVVPLQTLAAGTSTNVYAVARDGGGNYLSNSVATWSLVFKTGGVVDGDLVPSGDNKSATFTAHYAGSAVIKAVQGIAAGLSGVQTVVAGAAGQTVVESKADGTGVAVPTQNLAAGSSINLYAVARDAQGNYVGNVAATWSLQSKTGGVADSDLVAAGAGKSATFTAHVLGSAVVQAVANTFAGQSGTITVNSAGTVAQLIWTTQPGNATNLLPFAQQPVLKTADAFGNLSTTGLASTQNVTVSLTSGTGPFLGTTNYNIGTSGSNGVVAFGDLEIDTAGVNKQITAMAAPAYSAPVSGMAVWLDANNAASVLTNASGSVTNWMDLSGNGNNFNTVLGTGTLILYTNATTASGRRTLTFPGVGSLMNSTYINNGNQISIFLVSKYKTSGAALGNNGPMAGTDGINIDYNNPNNFDINYQNNNPPTPVYERNSAAANYGNYDPGLAYHDLEAISTGSGNTIYINGGGAVTSTGYTGNFAVNHLSIGSRLNGATGSAFCSCDIAEVLVYNSALSTANRQAVEAYLSNKWFTTSFAIVPSNAVSTVFTVYYALPTATVSGDGAICDGGSTSVSAALTGATNWTVTWSDGVIQSNVATSPATRSVSPTTTTTYTVTALTDGNGYAATSLAGSAVVTVNPLPSTSGINGSSSVNANQAGAAYSVTLTAGSTYAWTVPSGASITAGQGSPSITVTFGTASGNVTVTETNASGCVGGPVSLEVSVVLNHPPVATDASYTRAPGLEIKINIADLIAVHVTDQDHDPITLQSVGSGTNGATIAAASGYVFYTPANNDNPDVFTYTVSDGQGGTATANIYIAVAKSVGQAKAITVTGGVATVDFAGIPGYTYDVQRSTDNMVSWQVILTTNAPANGIWRVTDDFGGNPPASAYYRPAQH